MPSRNRARLHREDVSSFLRSPEQSRVNQIDFDPSTTLPPIDSRAIQNRDRTITPPASSSPTRRSTTSHESHTRENKNHRIASHRRTSRPRAFPHRPSRRSRAGSWLPRDSRRLEARLAPRRSLNVSALTSFRRWRRHKGVKTTVGFLSSIRLQNERTGACASLSLDVGVVVTLDPIRPRKDARYHRQGWVRGSQPKDSTVSCPIHTRGCRNRPSKVHNGHR